MRRILYFSLFAILTLKSAVAAERTLEDVIAEVNPSVVSIVVDTTSDEQVLGAGIIISADGYIVTNSHVCEDAAKITIITVEDTEFAAQLIGQDEKTDIALLKAEHPLNFEPAEFADSDEVRVGNQVFAVGNPFGLGNSVSLGIISAKERDIEKGPYDNFLQTDVAINQGNSGGPLFNLDGKIIGMNTAIFSTDGQNMGVSFATPSNIVRWVVKQLQTNKKVVRGWLGVAVKKIRSANNDPKNRLHIVAMSETSPLLTAGAKVGDILLEAANTEFHSPRLFSLKVSQTSPGTIMPLKLLRDGEVLEIKVEVKEPPEIAIAESSAEDKHSIMRQRSDSQYYAELGLWVDFNDVAQEFIVKDVQPGSDAAHKGISQGDKFKIIDGIRVFGDEDLRIKIKQAEIKGKLTLQLEDVNSNMNEVTLNLKAQNEQN